MALALRVEEKVLIDRFLTIKRKIHEDYRKNGDPHKDWFLWAPIHHEEPAPVESFLKNWHRNLKRELKIDARINLHSTAYRKALRTKWSTEITDPEAVESLNRHFGHLATTAWANYCKSDKAKNAFFVSELVERELQVSSSKFVQQKRFEPIH